MAAGTGIKARPFLQQHVGAIVMVTPPCTHLRLALEGLHRGKDVLVEKPMTTDAASVHRLTDEAKTTSLKLMVGHTLEYSAAVRKLRDMNSLLQSTPTMRLDVDPDYDETEERRILRRLDEICRHQLTSSITTSEPIEFTAGGEHPVVQAAG